MVTVQEGRGQNGISVLFDQKIIGFPLKAKKFHGSMRHEAPHSSALSWSSDRSVQLQLSVS
ncbi:MAG: hypothetical protein RLZZ435_811 [Cyanobacteriota bacterium]|jgi:hypothetical protein